MSGHAAGYSISSLIASEEEDSVMPAPDFGTSAVAKRVRKPRSGSSTNESKPKGRAAPQSRVDAAKAGSTTKTRTKTARTRAPLKEKKNERITSDTEELEKFDQSGDGFGTADELEASVVAIKQPAKRGGKAQVKKGTSVSEHVTTDQVDGVTAENMAKEKATKKTTRARGTTRKPTAEPDNEMIIPETQLPPLDLDDSVMPDADKQVDAPTPRSKIKRAVRVRSQSRSYPPIMTAKRAGSASDTERGGNDPSLRRKLGDMTKRFESLDLKYRTLRETGILEAEASYEKLKKQTEQKTKATNDLISSLKKEMAAQTARADNSRSLQRQLAARDAEFVKLQSKVSQLSSSLSEAQNENKALSARVVANRVAASALQSADTKVPGSAVKSNGQARTIMIGSAEAAQAAQAAKLKEDLYSDLTGLILRGVTRGEDMDVYDCIQTGRNGSKTSMLISSDTLARTVTDIGNYREALHFKLAVSNDGDGKGSSYEDTEFQYTPLLDNNRDKELLELLPDYLTEEITFSRLNAARFHGRVVETLTKKHFEE